MVAQGAGMALRGGESADENTEKKANEIALGKAKKWVDQHQ
jgi:hypothetical protein